MSKFKGINNKQFCRYCMKKGLGISECFKLKNKEQKGNNNIKKFSEKFAKTSIADELEIDVLLVIDGETRSKTRWILNSSCSYHMCPHRYWFTTYKSVDCGVLLMENNVQCKNVRKGNI